MRHDAGTAPRLHDTVEYHGSLPAAHGVWIVTRIITSTSGDVRYNLSRDAEDEAQPHELERVHRQSITVLPKSARNHT